MPIEGPVGLNYADMVSFENRSLKQGFNDFLFGRHNLMVVVPELFLSYFFLFAIFNCLRIS